MKITLLDVVSGQSFDPSTWLTIDQDKINKFADATDDHQWIHLDVERCKTESPFKTTIAHGFLSASLMPKALEEIITPHPDIASVINYGINSVRFLESVRVNDQIRYVFTLAKVEQKPTGRLYTFDCVVEIKGRDKPALVGQFMMLAVIRSTL